MRAESEPRDPALPVEQLDLTCTRPCRTCKGVGKLCGKPAVVRIPMHFSGRLTVLLLCKEDRAWMLQNVPNAEHWMQTL